MARSAFVLVFAAVSMWAGSLEARPDSFDHTLAATSASGNEGTQASISVTYTNFSAADNVQGWSYGLCNDPSEVTPASVMDGATTATVNNGGPPDFNTVNVFPDGVAGGVVISFLGSASLSPGLDDELLVATYDLIGPAGTVASLDFCDTLGSPPTATVIVIAGESIVPAFQLSGEITINAGPILVDFIRGDCNDDGLVDIADGVWNLNQLFQGGPNSTCMAACDANGDGMVDLTDSTYTFNYRFLGGPPPPAPFPDCGSDGVTLDGDCSTNNCP